jgi:hypothetical protein
MRPGKRRRDSLRNKVTAMTIASKRLEKILQAVQSWPVERQEAAAVVLEQIGRLTSTEYQLNAEERADLEEALAEANRGEFASDAEVAAMFERHSR